MLIAIYAALAMFVQDVLAVCLVQAEARNRASLAAGLDSAMWLASISTTTISVTALQGHHLDVKAVVVIAVTLANVVGSFVGVTIGKRFIRQAPAPAVICPCANCGGPS
jgi:CDP-diglyceride synthetase